jgi:mannose-6-phosphate isomerase-like protein (cupin superfamily)
VIVTGVLGGSCSVAAVARRGETIENPVTGERITWIETAQSTGGELLACDLYLRPAAAWAAPAHRHLRQEERFEVHSGTVGFEVAGEVRMVSQGDEVTVPIGVAHRWWTADQDEVRARVELRPALDTETFFEGFFGLARDGKTNAKGIPGLLQIALWFRDLGDSCPQPVKPPPWVQRGVFTMLAPIGRLVGRRAVYTRYSPRHQSLAR